MPMYQVSMSWDNIIIIYEVIAINVSLEFVTFMLFVVVYKLVNVVVTMR